MEDDALRWVGEGEGRGGGDGRRSKQCGGFLRTLSLRDCEHVEDDALRWVGRGGEGRGGGQGTGGDQSSAEGF